MGSFCKKILTIAAIKMSGLPSGISVLYTPDWYPDS